MLLRSQGAGGVGAQGPLSRSVVCAVALLAGWALLGRVGGARAAGGTSGAGGLAQTGTGVPAGADQPYTLHVYEDLVQMPTLILDAEHKSYRGLKPQNFFLRLDNGPAFHPRHARLQGDDSMSVALLLDDTAGTDTHLVDSIGRAVSLMPTALLSPRDHISVFALDCGLVVSAADVPFTQAALQDGIKSALQGKGLHVLPQGACAHPMRLWDAIAAAAERLHDVPGRRVLIVASGGEDRGSTYPWDAVQRYADGFSISIFGVRPALTRLELLMENRDPRLPNPEDAFGLLCGGTGGVALRATQESLGSELRRVVDMLRKRYILEFARPANGTEGRHRLEVGIPDASAFIRTSGVAFPVQDRELLRDPNTVPTDATRAPVVGKRKALTREP